MVQHTHPGWPNAKAVSFKPARVGHTQKEAVRKGTKREEPILPSQGLLQRFRVAGAKVILKVGRPF